MEEPVSKISRPCVLIVTPKYPPDVGGASTYFGTLVEFLKKNINTIVITKHHKKMPFVENSRGFKIFRIIPNIQRPALLRRISSVVTSFIGILCLWLLYRPTALHSHLATGTAFGAGLFSLLFRVPLIVDVRGITDIERSPHIKLGRIKRYISIGQKVDDELLQRGIPKEKIVTIPVINVPIVQQMSRSSLMPRGNPQITGLFVGELSRHKGIEVLLNAFKMVIEQRHDFRLICVGNGDERKKWDEFLKQSGMEDYVHLLGDLDHRETLEQMMQADYLVLPSQSEGIPRVVLEAFAFEKPVIASAVGGVPEIVKHEENGILVNFSDVNEWAKAIIKLGSDKELREYLGKNGKHCLRTLPGWDEIAARIVEIYDE